MKHYTTEDGLIANPVINIFQDSKGFMWFVTWHGLSRYDGHRFTNYNTDNGLSHDLVNGIFEENGDFYVGMLDGSLDRISRSHITQNVLKEHFVFTRFIKQNDGSTFGTTSEEGILKLKNGTVSRVTKPLSGFLSDYLTIGDSLFLKSGVFYDDTPENPYRKIYSNLLLTDKSGNIITYVDEKEVSYIKKIYRDSKGRIWGCSEKGLLLLQVSNEAQTGDYRVKILPMPEPFGHPALKAITNDILEDKEGNLWIATLSGMLRVNLDGTVVHFSTENLFPSDRINAIFEDREGNIWVATYHGVLKFPQHGHIFRFTHTEGLASNELQDVLATKDKLWLTTQDGFLQIFDFKTGKVQTVEKRTPSHYQFLRMSNGKIYIGQGNKRWSFNEIAEFDPTTGPGRVILNSEKSFFTAESDSLGNFFLGTNEGIFIIEINGANYQLGSLKYRISSLLFDRRGYLWATTWGGGIQRLNLIYGRNRIQAEVEDMSHYFSADPATGLFEDKNGDIWVGSRYDGVARFTLNENGGYKVIHYTTSKGLMSFASTVASKTNDEGVLLRSPLGIDKVTRDGRLFNFSAVNHLFEEVRSISVTETDVFWAATTSGLYRFLDKKTDTLPPPPVYITKVVTADSLLYEPVLDKTLPLKFNQNNLKLEYAAPTFINEKAILYSFRLLGSGDEQWSNPALNNEVSFAGLRPKNYSFEVRALGWNGQWGPAATFSFIVQPPWWRTWGFYGFLFLIISFIVLLFVRRRIRYVRYQERLKQKVTQTELTALRAQMNPHFIFNILNSIEGYVLESDPKTAANLVQKFAWLSRLILENSASSLVSVDREWMAIKLYTELEAIRFDNSFNYEFSVLEPFDMKSLFIPPMLVQPLVENAIHHGIRQMSDRKGDLKISIEKKDKAVCFTITDNGVGMDTGKSRQSKPFYKKTSKGLSTINERLHLLNKEQMGSKAILKLEELGSYGTRAIICVPYIHRNIKEV